MFFPLGHDDQRARGLPWLTFGMLGVYALIFGLRWYAAQELAKLGLDDRVFRSPFGVGGFVPAVVYHAAWGDVLLDLWFLWLCGVPLEDRWGRRRTAALAVACGLAGLVASALIATPARLSMSFAGGAVAGLLGAFSLLHARTKMHWGLLSLRLRARRGGPSLGGLTHFTLPAWLALGVWFCIQCFETALGGLGDVPQPAHVGGFALGLGAAALTRLRGHDDAWVAESDRAATLVTEDTRLAVVAAALDKRRFDKASALLERLHRERPHDLDVQLSRLRLAAAVGDRRLHADALLASLAVHVEADAVDAARELWRELRSLAPFDAGERARVGALAARLSVKGRDHFARELAAVASTQAVD